MRILPALSFFALSCALGAFAACSATNGTHAAGGATTTKAAGGGGGTSSTTGLGGNFGVDGANAACGCSPDLHSVIRCDGTVLETCSGTQGCDVTTNACVNACQAAVNNKASIGCEYYATYLDHPLKGSCFAVFVANTWNTPAHLAVEYEGAAIDTAMYGKVPNGFGPTLQLQKYDNAAGLQPGQVVVLFLAGDSGVPMPAHPICPVPAAVPDTVPTMASAILDAFHVTSDVPVVAYQINPYGGGLAAVTGASLLLPTSAWDTNYIAVTAAPFDIGNPTLDVIAAQDGTHVTMIPNVAVTAGGGLPAGAPNSMYTFTLAKGQHAQFSQQADLNGSILQSDKPIGVLGGQTALRVPAGVAYADHAEQMIPPIRALGSEYVGVMYRPRIPAETQTTWRVVGVVDGTTFTWSSSVGGPATLDAGQSASFLTGTPFVVKSQDDKHPFMLFAYMSGSTWLPNLDGYGDADFVISVPPQQYLSEYVIFADPTYPETNLVMVREKSNGAFQDVNLDCLGTVGGWQAVGDYEWARVDLITGNFHGVGNCSTGRHVLTSKGRFGLWVWGWGSPETSTFTSNVSYGYPGGMNVQPINQVVVPAMTK